MNEITAREFGGLFAAELTKLEINGQLKADLKIELKNQVVDLVTRLAALQDGKVLVNDPDFPVEI